MAFINPAASRNAARHRILRLRKSVVERPSANIGLIARGDKK